MDVRDYVGIALAYAKDASLKKNSTTHCKWVRLAAKRFLKDVRRAKKPGCWFEFSAWHGNDVCSFVEKCPHVEGKWGSPTINLEPVQIFILVAIFVFRRRSDGRRRIQEVYIEIARGNAKSTLTASVLLYCQNCEGEIGPQVYSAATTGDQARIVWRIAKRMAEREIDMLEAFDLEILANSIVSHKNGGFFKPINAKASTQDGLGPHAYSIDELHAHKNRALFDVLKSARAKRKNPLSWYITTAGFSLECVCFSERSFIIKVLEGTLEADSYFGIIFTIDKDDDWQDEACWRKANPLLDVSVSLQILRDDFAKALASPKDEGDFKTKHLNMWLHAADAWLNMAQWDNCADQTLRIEDFKGKPCRIGVDLSDRLDIASVNLEFEDGPRVVWFSFNYLPEDLVAEKAHTVNDHYADWAREGHLTLTPGDWIDHQTIEADIRRLADEYGAREAIAFDQWASATHMAARLVEDGYNAVIIPKTAKRFTDPAKDIEGRIQRKRFAHDGNPILKWAASNCVVDRRVDGSILPKKETKSSANKIDPFDAGLLSAALRLTVSEEDGPSVYDTEELMVL